MPCGSNPHTVKAYPAEEAGVPSPSPAHEAWTPTDHHVIHRYLFDPPVDPNLLDAPLVVVVPGLGLPQYVFPTAAALARRGVSCAVLDVPGFAATGRHGSGPRCTRSAGRPPSGSQARALSGPVVVFGHSTGAQGALDAALRLQDTQPGLGLVMAGPTFTPRQRRFPRMAAAAATAYLRDSPGALVVVPTALRHAPGCCPSCAPVCVNARGAAPRLRVHLTLTAGEADTFAPGVAPAAGLGGREVAEVTWTACPARTTALTHAEQVAAVVVEAVIRVAKAA